MSEDIVLRRSVEADQSALEALYPDAFPDEDLLPLLRSLLSEGGVLSLVAFSRGALVGHIAITPCEVGDGGLPVGLLGPLAVAPDSQRRGIGAALVDRGLKEASSAGLARVCVLGDPAYYGRFGFRRETKVLPPYPLPDAWQMAWQSVSLSDAGAAAAGRLGVPMPWRDRALWSP